MQRKNWLMVSAAAVLLTIASMLFFFQPAFADGRWGADYFPNVPLTTQDGTTVRFYDDLLKGKTVVIELFYTHCVDSCPLETARLAQVQKMLGDRMGKDVFFYSISIDPRMDTPQALKDYAEKYHVGPGWLFLTGKKEDIDLVARKLGLYFDPGLNRDGHTVDLMLGNEPSGQWMKNSATDNARFLTVLINQYMNIGRQQQAKAGKSYAESPEIKLHSKGQYLFATRCAACHTIGHGDTIGPDLLGITSIRDRKWLTRMVSVPEELLAEKDPLATALFQKYKQVRMPNLRLDSEATDHLIRYLEEQSAAADQAPVAAGRKPEQPQPR